MFKPTQIAKLDEILVKPSDRPICGGHGRKVKAISANQKGHVQNTSAHQHTSVHHQ